MTFVPVVAIDGPSASGKGTLAARVAQALGFHYLDSGALYRLTALWIERQGLTADSPEAELALLAKDLPATFERGMVCLNGLDVSEAIRSEACGHLASRISVYPALREALWQRQRNFRVAPGLVADGRDMGSVVFPEASLKVFLTASLAVRATRRFKQLIAKGNDVIMEDMLQDLSRRDERDRTRPVAPLVSTGYRMLDTTDLTIEEGVEKILHWCQEAQCGTKVK